MNEQIAEAKNENTQSIYIEDLEARRAEEIKGGETVLQSMPTETELSGGGMIRILPKGK
jgi:hypothetical protein